MDTKRKIPFLPEETLRKQRVEVYFNDLKQRLDQLKVQHTDVINSSVSILQELDEVSTALIDDPDDLKKTPSLNIKQLIQEFEKGNEKQPTKPSHSSV